VPACLRPIAAPAHLENPPDQPIGGPPFSHNVLPFFSFRFITFKTLTISNENIIFKNKNITILRTGIAILNQIKKKNVSFKS
jgi:hypothetical protein